MKPASPIFPWVQDFPCWPMVFLVWAGFCSIVAPSLLAEEASWSMGFQKFFKAQPQVRRPLKVSPNAKTTLVIATTSDLHGWMSTTVLFPGQRPKGMLHLAPILEKLRQKHPQLILLDAGDTLQGSPTNYYFNHVAASPRPLPIIQAMNRLQYDVLAIGNHDFEPSPAVLEKNIKGSRFPWVGANVLDEQGQPLLPPYAVIERHGVRVGILGMLTPGTAMWINPAHLQGIRIEDMTATAKKWVPILKEQEHVDLTIGLFHSGHNLGYGRYAALNEGRPLANVAGAIADHQEGFDLIISGHAHQTKPRRATSALNHFRTPLLSPGFWGRGVSTIRFFLVESNGRWKVEKTEYDFLPASPLLKIPAWFEKDWRRVVRYLEEPTGVWFHALPKKEPFFQCGAALSHQALMASRPYGELSLLPGRWRWSRFRLPKFPAPLKRWHLFRWLPYDNSLVQAQLFGRQIQILLNAYQRQQQGESFRAGNYLVPGGFQARLEEGTLSLVNPAQPLPMQASGTYGVWMTNYHWNGGGGLRGEALLHASQKRQELSETLRDLVFSYLKNPGSSLPAACEVFLKKNPHPTKN